MYIQNHDEIDASRMCPAFSKFLEKHTSVQVFSLGLIVKLTLKQQEAQTWTK